MVTSTFIAAGRKCGRSKSTPFCQDGSNGFLPSEISGVDDFFGLRAGRKEGRTEGRKDGRAASVSPCIPLAVARRTSRRTSSGIHLNNVGFFPSLHFFIQTKPQKETQLPSSNPRGTTCVFPAQGRISKHGQQGKMNMSSSSKQRDREDI